MKKLLSVTIASIMLTLTLAGAACSKKVHSPRLEHNIMHFYSEANADTVFFADGKKLEDRIPGAITNIDTVNGREGFVLAGTALYHLDDGKLIKVYPAAVKNAVNALDGNRVLFCTASQAFLYDHEKGEYERIEDIDAKNIESLALSANGKTALITVKNDDGEYKTYLYNDGKTSEYAENSCAVAVSDNAERSYYLKIEDGSVTNELHFVKGKSDTVIEKNTAPYFEVTRDLNEITFDVDGHTHISVDGSKPKKLVECSALSYAGQQQSTMGGTAGVPVTMYKNTNTLLESIFYADAYGQDEQGNQFRQYDVYYVTPNAKSTKLAIGASQFAVSKDGKRILCIVDNNLYSVSAYSPKKPEKLVSNTTTFGCTPDFKTIYVIDNAGNLREFKDNMLSAVLINGIDYVKCMNNGTALCYSSFEDKGSLFRLKGEKASKIAGGVDYFEVYEECAMYLSRHKDDKDVYDLYVSFDGESFDLGEESVSIGMKQ